VADYSVDIAIAVKGAKELKAVRSQTSALSREINTLNKLANKQSKTLPNSFNTLNKTLSKAKGNLNKVALGTERYFRSISDVLDKEERLNAAYKKQQTDFKVIQRLKSKGLTINKQNIQLVRDELAAEIKLARAKKKTAQANMEKGKSGIKLNALRGLGGAVGSGIIGGGFPLLFGQGPTAAIGGALGGVAGGALSAIPGMGQFGFALSIAGTTIGSALDELTKALAKPTENIETLVTKLGLANTETGDLVLRMNELGMTSDASALLLNKFAEEFGLTQDQIKENTDKMNDFNNQINLLGTSLTLLVSDVLGPLITELNNLIQGKKPEGTSRNLLGIADFFTANAFDLDKRGSLFDEFFSPTGDKFRNPFNRANDPLNFNLNASNLDLDDTDNKAKKKTRLRFEEKELLPLKQALELEQKRLTTSTEDLNVLKEKFELENLNNELKFLESQKTDEVNQQLEDKIAKLKIVRDTQQQIFDNAKALADPFRELSNIIAQDIGNGIKGLIKGTQSLNDLLLNVVNKIGDAFLNAAIFGNFGGGSVTGGLLGILGFANGGRPPVGRASIVGERGPELFVPDRAGTIIPNNAMGGAMNVVVNVDASGSSVEGDEEQANAFGSAIATAIQSELIKQKRPGGLLA